MAGVEGQGPFLPAALYQVGCRLLGCRLANMQPGSRLYAWLFLYWIRGVHAGQRSPVGGHLLLLAHSAMPSPCLLWLVLGRKGLVGTLYHYVEASTLTKTQYESVGRHASR